MKKFIYVFLILNFPFWLFAQNKFDLFYVGGNYNFMKTTIANPDQNYESSLMVNLSVPVVFKDSSAWIILADYQSYFIPNEYLSTDSAPLLNLNVHGFILRTGYIYRFNSGQALQMLVIPRVMTDFNASFSNAFQLGGMITYEKVQSENLTWRAGLLVNNEFFGLYLTPVLYLDWKIAGKIKFTGLLPVYGKLYIEPAQNLSAGLHFIGLTTSYRINEKGYENYYTERNSIDLSCFVNSRLFNNVFLEARMGYSIVKDYALYAGNQKVDLGLPLFYIGDDRTRSNGKFKGSPLVHLRLVYSLPLH